MVPLPFDLDVDPLKPAILTRFSLSNDSSMVVSFRLVMVMVVPVSMMANVSSSTYSESGLDLLVVPAAPADELVAWNGDMAR